MKCMETYFSASVMEKIDDILDRVEQLGSKVAVLNYGTAAQSLQIKSGQCNFYTNHISAFFICKYFELEIPDKDYSELLSNSQKGLYMNTLLHSNRIDVNFKPHQVYLFVSYTDRNI